MKSRKQILSEVMHSSIPKFNISLLTDEQLDDLESIMKRNRLNFISIEKAVQKGFKVPNDPNEIINNLIKFYKK